MYAIKIEARRHLSTDDWRLRGKLTELFGYRPSDCEHSCVIYSVMQATFDLCLDLPSLIFLSTTSSFASFSAYGLCCLIATNLVVGNALPTEKFRTLEIPHSRSHISSLQWIA